MMNLFPAHSDDLIDVESLPPTDATELNYRTRPLPLENEIRLALLVLFAVPAALVAFASVTHWLVGLHPLFDYLLLSTAASFTLWLVFRRLTGGPYQYALAASFVLSTAGTGGMVLNWAILFPAWFCRLALVLVWLSSALIARQVATWILASPSVDYETTRRWEVNVPRIVPHGLSLDCPELLTFSISPLLLGPSWWCAAWLASEILDAFWLWPVCYAGVLHAVWLAWHLIARPILPWPDPFRCWRDVGRALRVFATYDVYQTPAAGLFRFPTRWLRPVGLRWAMLTVVLVLTAFCSLASCPNPGDTFKQGGTFVGQLLWNWAFVSLTAPSILATTLWFMAGSLLARFDAELTADSDRPSSPWDNYVDRIINSADPLEREHFFVGTSMTSDYPVLVHREILDQHVHILGDTGASKTSLGIAPLATQLIAHADSTIVIVDLKGDRALFEICRREAARTGRLRFRWLSNEVGNTTFAFNPFLQTHNRQLAPEQFVQELLQGLSLDYGLQYGAGYFTAMNEIVLNLTLQNCPAKSFRQLDPYLRDKDFFASVGHTDDWKQARHLGALVTRLAGSELLNVVPGMYEDQPDVHRQALDVANLFEEPQVVYLSLRSAIEPTGAPTIARLFLWAAFCAASRRTTANHRVYFFLDEFQQVISDGMKLIFEQFRDLGGTIIAAHQTAGQLNRQGTDLGETIDSCSAMKQTFRASDFQTLQRLEKLAGTRREKSSMWVQRYDWGAGDLADRYDPIHAKDGLVRAREEERPRLDFRRLQGISSHRQASLLRFTLGSGYTQFAGGTVPVISPYQMTFDEYLRRKASDWPRHAGAFMVPAPSQPEPTREEDIPTGDAVSPPDDDFVRQFENRARNDHG